MSRVAKKPVVIPAGVEVKLNDQIILVKGKHGELVHVIHKVIDVQRIDNQLIFALREGHTNGWAIAGTTRSILNGMMIGVTNGFTKKLQLIGVGYRVSVTGNVVNLSLGFSHRIDHTLPAGITAECQSQTEIILRGFDKQLIGQVSADLRAYRRPEPYKGKGMRYSDELVFTKEAKKK